MKLKRFWKEDTKGSEIYEIQASVKEAGGETDTVWPEGKLGLEIMGQTWYNVHE